MTATSRDEPLVVAQSAAPASGDEWVARLSVPGPGHDDALRQLHDLLLRAARHQVARMRDRLGDLDSARVDELAQQAADEAMVSLLGKLSTFEGRSRFTTWAYKFAILQAAVEVNRHIWRHRTVPLDEVPEPPAATTSPEDLIEAADLASAVTSAIHRVLTDHQRRVVTALVIDEVPIDVLAEQLGTSRNTLYKTMHDARARLRSELMAAGYPVPVQRGGRSR